MIGKEFQKPIELTMYEILLKRLSKNHIKMDEIKADWAKKNAGYNGEKSVYRMLTFLDEQKYYIFHNLRLKIGQYYFQMDFLIVTTKFILIVEAKNIAGTLLFDEFGQFIRIIEEKEEGFQDPISQVQLHKKQLQKWLEKNHFPKTPIEYTVVVSKPSSIIKMNTRNHEVRKRVLPLTKLLEFIENSDRYYKNESLTMKQLKIMNKNLLKDNTPFIPNLLEKYNLSKNDILTGVQCPKCLAAPMKPIKGTWRCPQCSTCSKSAHHDAIYDYMLLINSSITNRDLREFLHIPSRQKATKILTSLNLIHTGGNKNRQYFLPKSKK
ncbi:nuclease-related domain-containing protein [Neobacillus sp. K501]